MQEKLDVINIGRIMVKHFPYSDLKNSKVLQFMHINIDDINILDNFYKNLYKEAKKIKLKEGNDAYIVFLCDVYNKVKDLISLYKRLNKPIDRLSKCLSAFSFKKIKERHDEVQREQLRINIGERKHKEFFKDFYVQSFAQENMLNEAKLITNEYYLFDEGLEMDHCVYSYLDDLVDGHNRFKFKETECFSLIYSILRDGKRHSTAEIRVSWKKGFLDVYCSQHYKRHDHILDNILDVEELNFVDLLVKEIYKEMNENYISNE